MLDTGSLTLSIGQVARLLGMTDYTFRQKRAELEALGFPKKLPGLKKWSRPAILIWFRTNGGQLATPEIDLPLGQEIAAARDELEGEYAS